MVVTVFPLDQYAGDQNNGFSDHNRVAQRSVATNGGKCLIGDANSCKEGHGQARRCESEGHWFTSQRWQSLF